jgi:hypothetical protein
MTPDMTPERWRLVGDLFTRALEEPEATRPSWLAACGAPDDVRRDVAALLASHVPSDAFLAAPARVHDVAGAAPASSPELRPGAAIGPYRLVRVLGRGGMGVVYEAEDTRLQRRVALKAVSSLRAADALEQQRLRHEARAAAALVHPNIATIYALEEIDGQAYISSEYLEGETLRAVLQRGPLPREQTLAVAHALASALATAHAHGIVHRDLKPENVLQLPDGRVKVLDFGLARFEGDARRLASVSRLTATGLVAGTPGYMAPEQLLGLDVDGRADQFALGTLVAELASGANPFEGGSLPATIARVLGCDGIPPSSHRLLPHDLAAVVHRCTRQRPEDRYPSTGDLVEAIAALQRGEVRVHPLVRASAARPAAFVSPDRDPSTGRRPALWWWRFHQAAAAAVYWMMIVPAWWVHRDVARGLPWFLGCLAATIVAANLRLHLRFSAAVLPHHLHTQRAKTRGWVALGDWTLIVLWAYAGAALTERSGQWAAVFFAFSLGVALIVALIEPATTRAAFESSGPERS